MSVTPIRECNALATNNEELASSLGTGVEWIKEGCYGPVRNVVLLIEKEDGEIEHLIFGQRIDRCRVIGLLTVLASRMANP